MLALMVGWAILMVICCASAGAAQAPKSPAHSAAATFLRPEAALTLMFVFSFIYCRERTFCAPPGRAPRLPGARSAACEARQPLPASICGIPARSTCQARPQPLWLQERGAGPANGPDPL